MTKIVLIFGITHIHFSHYNPHDRLQKGREEGKKDKQLPEESMGSVFIIIKIVDILLD